MVRRRVNGVRCGGLVDKGEAIQFLKDAVTGWREVAHPPSLVSYWAGRIAGVEWAIRVLLSEDGDVG